MAISQQLIYEYHALISHSTEPRVLLLPAGDGWALPRWESTERHFWQTVDHVNQALRDQLGVNVTTLRCVGINDHVEAGRVRVEIVYVLEDHSSDWASPDSGRWIGSEDIDDLRLAVPEHRSLLLNWFARALETSIPPNQPPWYRPGWFASATAWMNDQLERCGLSATGPVEQLRSWERSALLRVNTNGGYVYFKAVPPMFAHEPPLTQMLAERDPAHFPRALVVDVERRSMLMSDVGGPTLDQLPDVVRWQAALRHFARAQISLIDQVDMLLALGCPARPLDQLADHIDALLADTPAMLPDQPGGLSQDQIDALRARAGQFRAMCVDLARYNIPETLEHGDFAPGQIVVVDDSYVFIDWSDSSIAHPFFSMNFFCDLTEIGDYLPSAPGIYTRLRDAYLEPWSSYEPIDRLIQAYEIARPLSALHNAVIYHRHILPNMENQWEMRRMLPFYLKKLL